jgi:hypothetical protein
MWGGGVRVEQGGAGVFVLDFVDWCFVLFPLVDQQRRSTRSKNKTQINTQSTKTKNKTQINTKLHRSKQIRFINYRTKQIKHKEGENESVK